MPMPIAADDLAAVYDLAQPVAPERRADFVAAVVERVQAAPIAGPGIIHRVARETQRAYFDPPGEASSRRGIGGPRGPRNAGSATRRRTFDKAGEGPEVRATLSEMARTQKRT
jgi:hypothetical protein